MTIKELQNVYPYVNWQLYLNNILRTDKYYLNLDENEIINVAVPPYIRDLADVLAMTDTR